VGRGIPNSGLTPWPDSGAIHLNSGLTPCTPQILGRRLRRSIRHKPSINMLRPGGTDSRSLLTPSALMPKISSSRWASDSHCPCTTASCPAPSSPISLLSTSRWASDLHCPTSSDLNRIEVYSREMQHRSKSTRPSSSRTIGVPRFTFVRTAGRAFSTAYVRPFDTRRSGKKLRRAAKEISASAPEPAKATMHAPIPSGPAQAQRARHFQHTDSLALFPGQQQPEGPVV